LVFGTSRTLICSYSSAPGVTEHYIGELSNWGADVGYLSPTIMWTVTSPRSEIGKGALAGSYAERMRGSAPGNDTLVGGFNESIALHLAATERANIAVGATSITLRPVRQN
jgi:hypothetical protein